MFDCVLCSLCERCLQLLDGSLKFEVSEDMLKELKVFVSVYAWEINSQSIELIEIEPKY